MPLILTAEQQRLIDAQYEAHRQSLAVREAERAEILLQCEFDPLFRAVQLERLRRESDDGDADIFFINTFCYTYDPRPNPHTGEEIGTVPFLLDDEQADLIRTYNRLERAPGKKILDVVKSRDRGGSWIVSCALPARRWLFRPSYSSLVGTITEDDIDKQGEPRSLFWKFDFIIDNLPQWMLDVVAKGWEVKSKRSRPHLIRINPANPECTYKGDPITSRWGGGDRTSSATIDEVQDCGGDQPDVAKAGFDKVNYTTNFRIRVGTPPRSGMQHWWSKAVEPEEIGGPPPPGLNRFDLCWENDPRYNAYVEIRGERVYPWFEAEKENNEEEVVARELGRNFRKSVVGAVYPQVNLVRRARFDYDPALPLYLTADPGGGDEFALAWIQHDYPKGRFRLLQTYRNSRKLARFYLALILGPEFKEFLEEGYRPDLPPPEDVEIMERVAEWDYAGFFGDPAGRNKEHLTSGNSAYDEWTQKSREISPYRCIPYVEYDIIGGKDHTLRQKRLRWMLPRLLVNVPWAPDAIPAIGACQLPRKQQNSTSTARPSGAPMHHTFGRDLVTALEYFAISDIVKRAQEQPGVKVYTEDQTARVFSWGEDDSRRYGDRFLTLPGAPGREPEEIVVEDEDVRQSNLARLLSRPRFASSRRRRYGR